jgi:hypothetical protein
MRKMWGLKIKRVKDISSKKIETKYHKSPLPLLHVFFLARLLLVFRENL